MGSPLLPAPPAGHVAAEHPRAALPPGRVRVRSRGRAGWVCAELRALSVSGTALEESFKEYGKNREAMRLCREGECYWFVGKSTGEVSLLGSRF